MAEVFFVNPPILRGKETEQLMQLYSYLTELSGKLNTALMTVSVAQLDQEGQAAVRYASPEQEKKRLESARELIIKTANIVRTEMEEIRTTLHTQITANSDEFGRLMEQLENEITLSANGISQLFTKVTTLEGVAEAQQAFRSTYQDFINIGVIGQENGEDIIGIAIGEHITKADGTLNLANKMATFTKDKLAFYQGGDEPVAYFTGRMFYVSDARVSGTMQIGNHIWKALNGGALALIAGSSNGGT